MERSSCSLALYSCWLMTVSCSNRSSALMCAYPTLPSTLTLIRAPHRQLEAELVERVRAAVLLPVRIAYPTLPSTVTLIRAPHRQLEAELVERVRAAVLLPVRIAIKDVYDDTCTELLVTASLDSGGRGRPRVTYDVTAALNTLGARPRLICPHSLSSPLIAALIVPLSKPYSLKAFTASDSLNLIGNGPQACGAWRV